MSLTAGTRLGVYEVVSALGAGGMGEVYRARDTKLGRDVALKVVSESFTYDPERVARFQREAQLLAALNHPHIATIHGLEESAGAQLLVMELVEGGTLADRLTSGPIPVAEALAIAPQVSDALQAAHEKGIIHRDLKPANIAFTADGQVKVLDFGLAKALEPAEAGPYVPGGVGAGLSRLGATHSPTLSLAATQAGVILGTAAYMAPEQAKGKPADKRSDIWAFGCVLYEMLTGKRAFDGDDATDVIGAIVRLDPDWSAVPDSCPALLRRLLRRCLEKDRQKRLADASTILFALDEAASGGPAGAGPTPAAAPVRWWPRATVAAAIALVLGGAGVGGGVWISMRSAQPRVLRTMITTPGSAVFAVDSFDRSIALTPDGTRLIYVGNNGRQLFSRRLDDLEPTAIANATGLRGAFVSPDGQWVLFFQNNTTLRKVGINGGPAVTLAATDSGSRGATWVTDSEIVFATNGGMTGLQRVSAAGGETSVLSRPNREAGEGDHLWPEALPDGRILFTVTATTGRLDAAQIAVLDPASGTQTVVVRGGSHAHYVASGHLVYASAGGLQAVAFDLDRLQVRGTPVAVVPRVAVTAAGGAGFDLARDGTLVYVDAAGGVATTSRTMVWVDRQGRETALSAPPRSYQHPRLAPDGTRVAVGVIDQEQDLWIWDLTRSTMTRLSFDPQLDWFPIWTPDSRRLVFGSQRGLGLTNIYIQPADGTGMPTRILQSDLGHTPSGMTPDGRRVIFSELAGAGGGARDVRMVALEADSEPETLIASPFEERNAVMSPDGRWLAYESDSSGQLDIYVRPFPDVNGGLWQVSTTGGVTPLWAPDGRELFYRTADGAVMAVPVSREATWSASIPVKVVDGRYSVVVNTGAPGREYDVSPDGRRFLMLKEAPGDQTSVPPQIVVVQNWFEELKRLVPAN